MMKFKKFLAAAMTGAMMLGMVATAAPAVSTYAGTSVKSETPETMIFHSARTNTDEITGPAIDYKNMKLTIESNDPLVVVKFYKDAAKSGETDKPSNTYTYSTTGGKVTIDLGFYKPGKKNAVLKCYGSNGELLEGYTFTLATAVDKLKIKADATKTDFYEAVADKSDPKITAEDVENYSYRSLNGAEWKPLKEFVDDCYSAARVAGTTIWIRKNATAEQPASAEVKVQIKGMTKAPDLKITYDKDVIKVKNMQVVSLADFVTKGEAAFDEVKPCNNDLSFVQLAKAVNLTGKESSFSVVFRTNKSGKVSMSNVHTFAAGPSITASGSAVTASGSAISVAQGSKSGKVKFTVEGKDTYEYSIVDPETTTTKISWKKITSAKDISFTGKEIWVRMAGVAEKRDQKGVFPSNVVKLTIPEETDDNE